VTEAAEVLSRALLDGLPAQGRGAAAAAIEAEFDRARRQAGVFPVEAWARCLRDFVAVHGRVPIHPPHLFSDALYFVKSAPAALSPGRVFVTDKHWVKAWVREAADDRFNIPTLALLRTAEEVRAYAFADRCVVKPTHLSGEVLLRPGGESLDLERIAAWLSTGYAGVSGEVNYLPLEPKVIVEPFVFDQTRVDDYKLFCVDGEVRLVQVDQDRSTAHRRVLYDAAGRPLPCAVHYPRGEERPLPANFEAMKALAEKLAAPFGFIRVDLYSDGRDVKVGELTNCHGGGLESFGSLEEEAAVSALLFGDRSPGEDGAAHPGAAARLAALAAAAGLPVRHPARGGLGDDDFLGWLKSELASTPAPRVLWLGAPGRSGPLAAEVRARGGRWLLVEDHAGLLSRAWGGAPPFEGEQVTVPLAAVDFLGLRTSFFDLSCLTPADRFDLVVVAGPSDLTGPMSRLLALPLLSGRLAPAFTLVLGGADGHDTTKVLQVWRLLAPQLPVSWLRLGRGRVAVVGTASQVPQPPDAGGAA
jgi:hypothetical protein